MEIQPKTFQLISLGCPKNLVDSEVMAGHLLTSQWSMIPEGPAQVCIVNTCSFVTDAAQESVDIIKDQAELKNNGTYQLLVVTGCLPEKYKEEIKDAIAEVDIVIGAEDFTDIVNIIEDFLSKKSDKKVFLSPKKYLYDENTPRILSGPPWRAYLKIAEGCDNNCGYCIIGRLRGSFRSRDFDSVIAEANNLANMGVKELILIAQDVTAFGSDRPKEPGLAKLLAALDKIEGIKWIRILYAHPAHLTEEIILAMGQSKKVLHYLDLPVQHASDPILKKMNRKADNARISELLDMARKAMPDIILRTSFIVGLPGETPEDFDQLKSFAKKQKFANVGTFIYSPEEGTKAFTMEPKVPEQIAQERLDELMVLQQEISSSIWEKMIGTKVEVLVEEELVAEEKSDYTHVGRIYGQSPEIDGLTFCRISSHAGPGDFVTIKIVDATTYDLFGIEQ